MCSAGDGGTSVVTVTYFPWDYPDGTLRVTEIVTDPSLAENIGEGDAMAKLSLELFTAWGDALCHVSIESETSGLSSGAAKGDRDRDWHHEDKGHLF